MSEIPTDLAIILRNPPDNYPEWEAQIKLAIQWEKVKFLLEGLNQIAAWYEGPIVNGSFDEPASAKTARQALEKYHAAG